MVEYGHDCDGPVTVIVHDATIEEPIPNLPGGDQVLDEVGIPVVGDGITVHERKDGPTAVTRRAEVDFPLSGLGDDWVNYINAFDEGGGIQRCTIIMQPDDLTERLDIADRFLEAASGHPLEQITMVGYIGAVGANGANTGHITVFGPYNLLQSVPVGVHLNPIDDTTGTLRGVSNYFIERFINGQTIFSEDDIQLDIVGLEEDEDFNLTPYADSADFSANRDTLVDVAKWIYDDLGFRIWFEPVDRGKVELRLAGMTDQQFEQDEESFLERFHGNATGSAQEILDSRDRFEQTFDATDTGNIEIINNNALYEMKPYNALTLKGSSDLIELDGSYPEATAWYPPLVERAGGRITTTNNSSSSSADDVEREARQQLKESLDGVSGGTMDVLLSPFISPYDRIRALPGCNGQVDAKLPELTYEVQRTAHKVQPNNSSEGSPVYTSELAVSMSIDPALIESSSTMKDLTPSEGANNEPPEGDGFAGAFVLGI